MLNLTEEEKKVIRENLENGEELLKSDDVNDILIPFGFFIADTLGTKNDPHEPTDETFRLEKMYDNIYLNNE